MSAVEGIVAVVGVIIVAVVAVWVAAPLFGAPAHMDPASMPSERDRLERQKRQALFAIKETELDYEMGKLSREDYERMRARFEASAIEAMDAIERVGRRA